MAQPEILKRAVRIACVQICSTADKAANIKEAHASVLVVSRAGAGIIILPECFNSPYSVSSFAKYAERIQPYPPSEKEAPTFHSLARLAKQADAYIIGGSIPELEVETGNLYNTTLVFGRDGSFFGYHRKAHLFDIDIKGHMTFRESDVLSAGDKMTIVDLSDYGKIGLGICYDVRFPEPAMVAARQGVFAMIYPSAFNSTTGPLHWELLARSRALDNQVYVALCSQAFDPQSDYPAWGYSIVADPSGQVVTVAGREKTVVYADLDNDTILEHRQQIPTGFQRRFDLYPDISKVLLKKP